MFTCKRRKTRARRWRRLPSVEVVAVAGTTSVMLVVVAAARRINNGHWLLDYCPEGVEIYGGATVHNGCGR
jgi:hypothetical protein